MCYAFCHSIGTINLWHHPRKGGGGLGWVLEICHMFVDSTIFKQYLIVHFCEWEVEVPTIGHFLWMSEPLGACMKDQLYNSLIFNNYSSFVNSLLHIVRSYVVMVFTYVKNATEKLKTRSLVMQLLIS